MKPDDELPNKATQPTPKPLRGLRAGYFKHYGTR